MLIPSQASKQLLEGVETNLVASLRQKDTSAYNPSGVKI